MVGRVALACILASCGAAEAASLRRGLILQGCTQRRQAAQPLAAETAACGSGEGGCQLRSVQVGAVGGAHRYEVVLHSGVRAREMEDTSTEWWGTQALRARDERAAIGEWSRQSFARAGPPPPETHVVEGLGSHVVGNRVPHAAGAHADALALVLRHGGVHHHLVARQPEICRGPCVKGPGGTLFTSLTKLCHGVLSRDCVLDRAAAHL